MVGNCLNIKFTSSLMAKQNLKSLSQWGYKLVIRPIFINDYLPTNTLTEQEALYNLKLICRCVEGLAISLRIILDYFIKGQQKRRQREFTQLLRWKLL